MRVAVISDIHSNLTAFEAVVADFGALGATLGSVDEVWCLGDVVGYGPDPNECIRLLRQLPHTCVAGNHDWASVQKLPTEEFNESARSAVEWTAGQLTAASRDYLLALPTTLVRDGFTLVHGSPRDPVREYLLHTRQAVAAFALFSTRTCLIGHSHVPLIFEATPGDAPTGARYVDPDYSAPLELGSTRWIVNPGSVGQPRDCDPAASYVVLDTEAGSLRFRRVAYDVKAVQARMRVAGLPAKLWQRLSYGM